MTPDIQNFARNWDRSFNPGDLSALVGFYAPEANVIPAGAQAVTGADTIGKLFADVRSKGLTEHEIAVRSVIDRGDTVVAIGTWALGGTSDSGTRQQFGGNWVNVLKREGNSWKNLLHTWN